MLPKYQQNTNEDFLNQVISKLNMGGVWMWRDTCGIYTKIGDDLLSCNREDYDKVKAIVSRRYMRKFRIAD